MPTRRSHSLLLLSLTSLVLPAGCHAESVGEPDAEVASGYAGDELALAPPDPSQGLQLRYGPASYSEADVAPYLLGAGEEEENCYMTTSPNDEEAYIVEYHGRMRPGSHHLILWGESTEYVEGLGRCPAGDRFILGSQSREIDVDAGELGQVSVVSQKFVE